jgi:DNA helicase HerA-like ATPase
MADPILVAKAESEIYLLPKMANRHGLIAGATGTGKTVTLQRLAEGFSRLGVPVFLADVKGDLSGVSQAGKATPKIDERIERLGLKGFQFAGCPVQFWDVFGEEGHPVRATISEMGPLLLSRLLNLNETQSGVLTLAFKVADNNGLLLLDLKDLRAILQFVGDHARQLTTEYGNISAASVGAIQRNLLGIEQQGAEKFFGEPALDLHDFLQTDHEGKGLINILAAEKLLQSPKIYATMLLWMLAELFERLPEIGDPDKPVLVFFFDEAHLLFADAPPALMEKIEQVVRLIRSKGVGVYFATQNPLDIPERVLGQLGNRVQHALRAFTPRDQKTVKAAAATFRPNPSLKVDQVITELGVGEALISLLDDRGTPSMVERALVVPPTGQIGPISAEQRQQIIKTSQVFGHYEQVIDRESAYEILTGKAASAHQGQPAPGTTSAQEDEMEAKRDAFRKRQAGREATAHPHKPGVFEKIAAAFGTSAARSIANTLGREISRGLLGSILGGTRSRRR